MLIVHSFPAKDPLDYFKDGHSKPDNYIRVSRRLGGDHHVFPFASGSLVEATWALEESRRIFAELGGSLKGVVRTIWKPNPAFSVPNIVGEGARIEDKSAPRRGKRSVEATN
jgi:hypothetical protein